MDYEPQLRAMLLGPATDKHELSREPWYAVVLTDTVWPTGLIITVGAHVAGLVVIEEND